MTQTGRQTDKTTRWAITVYEPQYDMLDTIIRDIKDNPNIRMIKYQDEICPSTVQRISHRASCSVVVPDFWGYRASAVGDTAFYHWRCRADFFVEHLLPFAYAIAGRSLARRTGNRLWNPDRSGILRVDRIVHPTR